MPLQPNGPAPYTTTIALTTVIDAFRDRGLGVPITADVIMRSGVAESLASRTRQSLLALELIDETGRPTQQFEDLRLIRGEDEFRQRLQEWLRGVYADVLQYCDPSADSAIKVAESFRTYEPAGQRRAMGLLLTGLWKYAGLPVPEGITSVAERKPPKVSKVTKGPAKQPARQSLRQGPETRAGTALATAGLPPGLVGLLHQIPREGHGWPAARREAFLGAFHAVLDFSVPVRESEPESVLGEEVQDP